MTWVDRTTMVFVIILVSSSPKRLLTTTHLWYLCFMYLFIFPLVFILLFNYISLLQFIHIIKMRKFFFEPLRLKTLWRETNFWYGNILQLRGKRITLQQIYRSVAQSNETKDRSSQSIFDKYLLATYNFYSSLFWDRALKLHIDCQLFHKCIWFQLLNLRQIFTSFLEKRGEFHNRKKILNAYHIRPSAWFNVFKKTKFSSAL